MANSELQALRIEPSQPGAQQGRGLEPFRKHPPAGADKSRLSQGLAPFAQAIWRKGFDCGFQPRLCFAIAREKLMQRFAVREVEPAAPGHQEFPPR